MQWQIQKTNGSTISQKALMVYLGFKPRAAEWEARRNHRALVTF